MKKIIITLLLTISIAAVAQHPVNLGLIPTPQRVELTGETSNANLKVKELHVDTLPVETNLDQAYQLLVEPRRITIRYVADEGLRNAHLTLDQLRLLYGDNIPCCTITDWPAYRYRGWMDDISRGPVPHETFRQRQWQTLHALKYNFCNYYTEHTLYQKEFPDLAPAYADCRRHPDEVINLQLFAHAEKTLRVPFYQHLMDSRANFNPAVAETYDFLRKRVGEAFRQLPDSPFFIINCDETEQLGTGRARHLVDSLGPDQVYVNHINRCYEIIKNLSPFTFHLSPRIVMWADIVAKNPSMMRQLPPDMTYILWAYEPLDSYDHLIRPFKEHGNPFWVAPSLSHSSNMIPNPYRYMKNIANLARDGWRNGAEGLMNTCWDDNGEALFDNCWHGLFWSAEMSWNPIRTADPAEFAHREAQFNANFARLFYGKTAPLGCSVDEALASSYTAQLYSLGSLAPNPFISDWYTSAALLEPLLNFNPDNTSTAMHDRIAHVCRLLDTIHVDSAANPHAHYALHRIRATAQKAQLRYVLFHTPEDYATYADDYMKTLFDLKREYLRLWDQENGDYERYIILNRYDDLAREVLTLDRHVFMSVGCDAVSQHPTVTLRTLLADRPIYYTLDGSEPTASSTLYTAPFPLERSATIRAITYNEYGEGVISEQYLLSHLAMGAKITLNTPYSTYKAIYRGGGDDALIDGQLGSNTTYADGHWQGYWGDSIDAVIELSPFTSHLSPCEISMRFMQNTFDWILAPTQIKVYTSPDGKTWTLVADEHFAMDPRETGMRLKQYTVPFTFHLSPFTYLRVVVPNPGPLPAWHPAPGQPSYLFTDEIVIR